MYSINTASRHRNRIVPELPKVYVDIRSVAFEAHDLHVAAEGAGVDPGEGKAVCKAGHDGTVVPRAAPLDFFSRATCGGELVCPEIKVSESIQATKVG